jgi:bifunctional non-homologous end joining protein LigD
LAPHALAAAAAIRANSHPSRSGNCNPFTNYTHNRSDITHIEFAHTATDPANKERLFRHLQAERREGVVFKRLDAPYTPGRPNSGGNQLKHKFYATCSAVVAKINDKRSVELRLLNGKVWIPCGNVTIPPNSNVPAVGTVVELRYLYAFRESNALYQPV